MFGTNVSLLLLVFLFNCLISYNRIMCWFSFFMCLHFGDLQVSQKHQVSSACFISFCVCPLVVLNFFKNVEPSMLIFFFFMFTRWLFVGFSKALNN
jgi:hypothetical protein